MTPGAYLFELFPFTQRITNINRFVVTNKGRNTGGKYTTSGHRDPQSSDAWDCPMHLVGFLHLVYDGKDIKLRTRHFPALPNCDSLSALQPLYSKSLTVSENNKDNKEAKYVTFTPAI